MDAADLTLALGGAWHGGSGGAYGQARCPAHNDRTPSLTIRQGDMAPLLHCHAGCAQAAVIDALRGRGLWPERERPADHRCRSQRPRSRPSDLPTSRPSEDQQRRHEVALAIWDAAGPTAGTVVERYLRGRGIMIPIARTLRWHSGLRHKPTGLVFPAMVAAVQGSDRRVTAVHRTYLTPDGRKAEVASPKMALGPIGGGAVRLGHVGSVLGLAEGVETALSAMQLFELPVWAALGSRLARVALPPGVRELQVFGDNGQAGHEAAEKAAEVFSGQGCRAVLRYPPDDYGDWNDVLRTGH